MSNLKFIGRDRNQIQKKICIEVWTDTLVDRVKEISTNSIILGMKSLFKNMQYES